MTLTHFKRSYVHLDPLKICEKGTTTDAIHIFGRSAKLAFTSSSIQLAGICCELPLELQSVLGPFRASSSLPEC